MNQKPFEEYYDERVISIDEELCALLHERDEVSSSPGIPPVETIENWARKFGLYEDLLHSTFRALHNAEEFRPRVEPHGFRKHLPLFQSVEQGQTIYLVTYIRQYDNAIVLSLQIDREETTDSESSLPNQYFQLSISDAYDCRRKEGGTSENKETQSFIVTPCLPDDLKGIAFSFTEHSSPTGQTPTGLEFVIHAK